MGNWDVVINVALLGTEKRSLNKDDVDPLFEESFSSIDKLTNDREDIFLQKAGLIFNYRQCGSKPLEKAIALMSIADPELLQYASPVAHAVLVDVLSTESPSLLEFWLEQCSDKNLIVQPETAPILLQIGSKEKLLRSLISRCCGKRGAWLQQFNKEWDWNKSEDVDYVWQTGTILQRKNFLAIERKRDQANGRELLKTTWAQEPATVKIDLLQIFKSDANEDDVIWLEELMNEKSNKVKEAALEILKTIPTSSIVQQYVDVLRKGIRIIISKGIWGIGSKSSLEIDLPAIDPSLFKTGIQQLSSQKNISDDVFIAQQLIAAVPPVFWQKEYSMEIEDIIKVFLKNKDSALFINALMKASLRFKDLNWLRALIEMDKNQLHPDAFHLLNPAEAEKYSLQFLNQTSTGEEVIQSIPWFEVEWSHKFATALLSQFSKFPYHFNKRFYSEHIKRFPISLLPVIDSVTAGNSDFQQMWVNATDQLKYLLHLKQQVITAFNE